MKKNIIFCLVILLLNNLCKNNDLFPSGWEIASQNDYHSENIKYNKGKIPSYIKADLNGDKIDDQAWILINREIKKYGLFVQLSNTKKLIKLDEISIKAVNDKITMGISIVEPGEYITACGKGYWDCGPDEPEKIKLLKPSIDFYQFESSNSFFYWDDKQNKFKRIWISD